MSEEKEITTGDVVCLKSEKDSNTKRKFTVGSNITRSEYNIHWYVKAEGAFKTAQVHIDALHKLEK